MTPEAQLAAFAEKIHLLPEDVDYLLGLMQEARGLASLAGAAAQKEADARLAEEAVGGYDDWTTQGAIEAVAAAIRDRGQT